MYKDHILLVPKVVFYIQVVNVIYTVNLIMAICKSHGWYEFYLRQIPVYMYMNLLDILLSDQSPAVAVRTDYGKLWILPLLETLVLAFVPGRAHTGMALV